MADEFSSGYALIIGVDQNQNADLALPAVANDISEFAKVLTHPERCGYPEKHIRVLLAEQATRGNIQAQLRWLREAISADRSGSATAIVYYSGHGHRDARNQYFLIPYDLDMATISSSAYRAEDFADAIGALKPQRMLVVLDCCHAGGMGVKQLGGMVSSAMPPNLFAPPDNAASAPDGTKGLEGLANGSGRAVLCSSTGHQKSYLRKDGTMSIFTYHLIEALTGHAQPKGGATNVLVSDAISHVTRRVPQSAKAEHGAAQDPASKLDGASFPIALLLGGKGLSEGVAAPNPLGALPPGIAPSYGIQNVTVGSNVEGDLIGTKIVHGDEIRGDYVAGDKIEAPSGRGKRQGR